jgi:hypothetical protein
MTSSVYVVSGLSYARWSLAASLQVLFRFGSSDSRRGMC